MQGDTPHPGGLKARAAEELKVFLTIALYLALFLAAFTNYRRLVLGEFGVTYLNYGFALIEAMIVAKVIMIGDWLGIGRRFERGPLIASVIWKSAIFSLFVFLFAIAEHLVEGLVHGLGWAASLRQVVELGWREILARVVIMIAAFLPFFAFWEIRRVLGHERFAALFFARRPETPG